MATKSRNQIIAETTAIYLANLNRSSPPIPSVIEPDLLEEINDQIELVNASILDKARKYKMLSSLPESVISQIILSLYHVANLSLDEDSTVLSIYCDSGKYEGLYTMKEKDIKRIIEQYGPDMPEQKIADVYAKLERNAPLRNLTRDRDLIPVNNGVFDYKSKTLLPFSPDMVFTSKSGVNYNPLAQNITIHNAEDGTDWDMEGWLRSLSDDPETIHLLWQVLGAVIRPNVPWNKSIWMYSSSGNNGKGTYCKLLRNICGDNAYASISIRQFSKDVFLDNLMRVSAIITDENQPGTYMDSSDVLKCAITGDPITIDRKFRSKLTFTFRGMVVQCFNEYPRIKDRTPSLLRRLLIVPMPKCFTGAERKYIKEDYLDRPEVLEYALCKVLHMDYYELSEPQACKMAMEEFKEYNDPLTEFWNGFRDQFVWDLLPFQFLYDFYCAWFRRFYPSGTIIGSKKFSLELRKLVENDTGWEATPTNSPAATGNKMDRPELLSMEYGLGKWQNRGYGGTNIDIKCTPTHLASTYRGLVRKTAPASGGIGADDETAG